MLVPIGLIASSAQAPAGGGIVAPTFIQEAETVWNTSTSPKTTASFNVLANDVLVAWVSAEDSPSASLVLDVSGGSLTWTERQVISIADYCYARIWTAIVDSDKAMTVSFTRSAGSTIVAFGGNVLTFRGSSGVGNSSKTNVSSGAPTLNIITTQEGSAIVVSNGDWNALDGASRTWRTNAGAFTEQSYFPFASRYTVYGGYHANAGNAGTYAVGLSVPGAQKYSIVAVEVKGT